jgi:hypothetical protein
MSESGRAAEAFGIHVGLSGSESGRAHGMLTVARWDDDAASWVSRKLGGARAGQRGFIQPGPVDFHRYGVRPYSETTDGPNLLVTGGWDRVLLLAIAGGGTTYASANARIGVGTATAAAASSQTDLSASTAAGSNRYWKQVTGAPTVGTGSAVRRLAFVSTFGTGVANFAWAEAGVDAGGADADNGAASNLLNRLVSAQGTKASGQTWTATFNIDMT